MVFRMKKDSAERGEAEEIARQARCHSEPKARNPHYPDRG